MAKTKKSSQQRKAGNGRSSSASAQGRANDAEALLKRDHRKVEQLFRQFEQAESEEQKRTLASQVCQELIVHGMLEEELFYPACREKNVESDLLDEAQVEHDAVKLMLAELMYGSDDRFRDAKATVLSEYVKHHVKEEENRGSGIFSKARKSGVDMVELGNRLRERKQELMERAGGGPIPAPPPRALKLVTGKFNRNGEEIEMERQGGRGQDRDERGRFIDEDDDGGSRGRGRGQSGFSRERDEEGRFMSEDEGSSRGGRGRGSSSGRYDEEYDDRSGRGGRGQSGFSRERDEEGRFMSDDEGGGRGRRSSSMPERDEQGRFVSDDDGGSRGGRGHGRGGWFGDSREHAEAARRGSSSGREDDENGRGSRGGRGHGQGGWFGDSRGHAEAARRGSSSRRDDDDNGRGSRGGRGQGQGGWFGDSRGHAEAARRGWRDRD
jgi:hemerythrin superfamily protein